MNKRNGKLVLVLLLAVSVMLAFAACGKKEDTAASASTPAAGAKELKISASAKTFAFDQAEYRVKKGEPLNITLVNADGLHGVTISGLGVKLENNKLTASVTPNEAKTYDIVCSIPCGSGHLQMKSKLIVE